MYRSFFALTRLLTQVILIGFCMVNIAFSQDHNESSAILAAVDNDANQVFILKRQLELEKIKSDIDKVKGISHGDEGHTVVTSVVIDKIGYKEASLRFIDGSITDVEIGSALNGYKVLNINTDGVVLAKCYHKNNKAMISHKCNYIKLKRSYNFNEFKASRSHGILRSNRLFNNIEYAKDYRNVPPIIQN